MFWLLIYAHKNSFRFFEMDFPSPPPTHPLPKEIRKWWQHFFDIVNRDLE